MADNLQFKIEVLGLTEDLREIGRLKTELENLGKVKKNLNKAVEDGTITVDKYYKQMGLLDMQTKATKANLKILTDSTYAQSTAFKGAEGSMIRMNEELGKLRVQYRNLSEAERENQKIGGAKLQQIQELDNKLKALDARVGNYQRNVGNYPQFVAGQATNIAQTIIPQFTTISTVINNVTESFSAYKQSLTTIEGQAAGTATKTGMLTAGLLGLAGAAIAAGAGLKELVHWAAEDQLREVKLSIALGGNIEQTERMIGLRKQLVNTTLFEKDDIENAINAGLALGRTADQIERMLPAAVGMAMAVPGISSVEQAVVKLSGSYNGVIKGLNRIIPGTKELTDAQLKSGAVVDLATKQFAKFATAGIDTAAGKIVQAKKQIHELGKEIGGIFLPIAGKFSEMITGWLKNPTLPGLSSAMEKGFAFAKTTASWQYEEAKKNLQKMRDDAKKIQSTWTIDEGFDERYLERTKAQGDATKKLREEEERLTKERTDAIKNNNEYLNSLGNALIISRVNAIADQQTREIESEKAKYQVERNELLNKQAEELKLIDEQIKIIEGKKGKATAKELADLKTLQENRVALIDATASMVEAKENEHQRAIADIKKKYDPRAKDDEIGKKYGEDVTSANTEYQVKLDALRAFYVQKGQLSDEDRKKQFQDETKLAIDLYTKEYQLLMAQIEARKKLGTITIEDYNAALKAAGELYLKIQTLGGNADAAKKDTGGTGGGWGKKATSFIAGLFSIKDNEAQQIISQVEQLAQNILNLWADMQNRKVDAELKRTNSRLKKEEDAELKSLEQRRRAGLITEGAFNREKENLDKKYNQKRQDAERKAFEQKKKNEQTMIWINAAVASISAFKESWIVGLIMTALIMAQAGIQSAFVGSQKYEGYARGGMIRGKRHSEGGEKYAVGGQVKELEDGEGVLNRNIMASSQTFSAIGTPREIASSLNSMYGWGVPFSGGYTPVSTPATKGAAVISGESLSAIDSMITQRINTLRVVVVESDITEKQNAVKKVQTLASW